MRCRLHHLFAAALLLAPAAGARSATPAAASFETEPLPGALTAGKVRPEELRGREIFLLDETRVGTLLRVAGAGVIRLDPSLGPGRSCLSVSLGLLRLASENRLVLNMNDNEFRAAWAQRDACDADLPLAGPGG